MRPARKRKLVDTVKVDWKVSIRRAYAVLKIDRSLYVYKSRRGEQAELKLKIKDICQTRIRYGYRRVHILIKREGSPVNPKRIYRRYKVSVWRTHFRVWRDGCYRPRFISSTMMRSVISGSHCVSTRNSRIPPSHVLMSASRL